MSNREDWGGGSRHAVARPGCPWLETWWIQGGVVATTGER